ncbi:hypothetical protein [Dendronalium sp. ChiSLP03b]|uniref:hypothetical protein n=1 Tax=Dendronalium sp. ChiSLP03b TaxID=3075381 RepID=UPI002AD3F019|nr:hypothetical protein [Dendronalium sp. ChiSLP03b]MDZ8206864.1 hypothetical protein [Dendronalium sp. ChiSLP03b]
MKSKILAIAVAAGTVVAGSLFSAPAHAQLTANQDVDVEINVPEVLFLRTFQTISLDISEAELGGVTTGGVGQDYNNPALTDGTTTIDQTSPFAALSAGTITKNVAELYAVWSNNPGGATITLTASTPGLTSAGGATATIANVTNTGTDPTTAIGLQTPYVGGADIEFDLSTATEAGLYNGGIINVSVATP